MGGASSKLFAAEGAKVGVVDRDEEAGRAIVAEIEAAGGTAMFLRPPMSRMKCSQCGRCDHHCRSWRTECAFQPRRHDDREALPRDQRERLGLADGGQREEHVSDDQGRAARHAERPAVAASSAHRRSRRLRRLPWKCSTTPPKVPATCSLARSPSNSAIAAFAATPCVRASFARHTGSARSSSSPKGRRRLRSDDGHPAGPHVRARGGGARGAVPRERRVKFRQWRASLRRQLLYGGVSWRAFEEPTRVPV